ncbi:MAG: transposase [Dolichospermum sp.]
MPRKPRNLKSGYSYHITIRCNNREFKLSRRECREVFLYAIKKALDKYNFQLYALLAGVHFTNQGSTTNPKKSKSGFPPPPCQVSETPELRRVVRQFIEANRAPRDVEKDF